MTDSEDELPPEREVKDFTFKQMRKIRMFEAPESLPTPRCSLLAVSSKFGLTFVGCPTGVKVIKTETIEVINESEEGSMQNIVQHCPSSFIEVGHSVRFVGLSGDHLTLSVCYENGNNTMMALFDIPTLWSTNNSDAKFGETMLSSDAGVTIVNLVWNPGFFGLFAVCLSSGSVSMMELTDSEVKTQATLPEDLKASAICWSPKGKQLVVGHKDGKLTQYSQTLEVKKEIPCPELFTDDPHLVADVLWIASTLFAAVYSSFEEGDTPKFQLISTPKNEPVSITNFDDIYYVMSEEREPVFYMKNLTDWNMVVSATSNGLEAAVVGKYGGEAPWEKWSFEEDSRPVMPLTNDNDDTFPMGLEIDFSSRRQITKGEEKLPPAPILMILSTDGVLCPFYMLNQTPNANRSIVNAPEAMALGGKRKSVVSKTSDMSHVGEAPKEKGSLKLGPVSLGASNQIIPESLSPAIFQGSTGSPLVGSFSLGNFKQPSADTLSSGTPTSVGPSTFSCTGLKPIVSTVASGAFAAASSSAFAVTGQKPSGLSMAFKLPLTQQLLSEGSAKPSAALPQLIKPTPTSQVQSSFPASSFQSPASLSIASTTKPVLAQGVSLGGDKPKVMSSAPSQVANQGMIAQPKPTPAQLAATVAKPLTIVTQPAATVTNPPTVSSPSTVSRKPTPAVPTVIEPAAAKPEPQREKSSLSGFRLPGQSSVMVASKQEATKKTASVSKDNVVEASVSENIREVISQFNEEMAKLSDSVKSMQSKCALAKDNEELHALRKETDEIGRTLVAINNTTKEQQKDIDEEKKKILEAFEMLEDARIRQERKNDPRYVQLLKSRALDPVNTSKMRDIRNFQFYLDKTLRDVNMILDEQWNKENERQRSMQRPALDEIYQTLRINYKIAQDQGAKLEKITEEMKNRKILSTSWQRSSVNTFITRGDAASMSSPFVVPKEELKSPSQRTPAPISPEKQAQLRSVFQKRRSTPVRRSTFVPNPAAKSPTVRPSKPQVPCYSSAPAAKPDSTAERTKETISFKPPAKEQENESESNVGDVGIRWKEETQSVKDEQQEDEQEEEQELKQLSEVSHMSSTRLPTSFGGFSLPGGSSPMPALGAAKEDIFSVSTAKDKSEETKTTDQSVRNDAGIGLQARPASQPVDVSGAFSSVKTPGLLSTTQVEPSKTSGSFSLPTDKANRTEVPPNIAAGMAAMSRASAAQDGVQQSNSKLDPSASIEPVTLVAYKPQAEGGEQATDLGKENNAAKAIANAALMAATAEAKKPSTKPQCSTEFVFKSSEGGKPGPPVVTFKPPNTLTQASQSDFTVAPNVTVFKPAFGPIASSSPTQSTSGGLQGSLAAAQTAIPPGQATICTVPFSFSTLASGLFAFGPSSPSPNLSIKSSNNKTTATSVSTAASTSVAGITPSARVSRNLFASGDSTSQTARTSLQQDQSKEATVTTTTASSSIVSAAGAITLATTTTTTFSFSAPAPSKGGFFKTLGPPSNSGSAFGPSNLGSGSTSILNSLMRSSNTGTAGSLFAAVTTTGSAPSSTAPLIQSKPTSPEKKDESAKITSAPSSVTASPAGMFQQALSESDKVALITTVNTINTLPSTTSTLGASATTTSSAPGNLFGIPSKTGVTAPSTTSSSSNLFGLSTGSQSSAFSSTTIASPFFTNINPASTKPSASTESYSSTTEGSSTLVSGGMFGRATTTTSAFGAVSTVASVGFGSLGTGTTTAAGGGLFGTSSSTAFAPKSIFGTSSGASTFNSSQPFTSPVNTKGSSFGSTPAFGSESTTAGTISTFGAPLATPKPTFGQSSFAPNTSAGFGQATSKPAENALGFGFSGFGLGGQGSSQTNKTNPFGVSQGFSSPAASQPSLFGGKSAADVFKAGEAPKPAFGSVPFSQSGFGCQPSGGFSGGSFSSQGGSVLASGFGFGGASSTGVSATAAASGFGSPQPFASPSSAGAGSVFGGAPSFGSSPAFGGAPTFGGSPQAPSFGATPSQGIFGGGKSGGFGQSSGSPTFGALATQPNVPTFGSLAGQSSPPQRFGTTQTPQQQQSPFSSFGGASQNPSGVSFSQWR